ncbi:bifunctional phosphoglucose/phosphomannose isomerase [bacterium]|nr:bifunctional phosphoglucose/phosphomannose isomerase [bacterium]
MTVEQIRTIDKNNYFEVLKNFDQQLIDAKNIAEKSTGAIKVLEAGLFHNIVISGMGGSAIAGDFTKNIFTLPVPVIVSRDYELPAFVNEHSLVIISSYSGNTEETISAFQDAVRKNATIISIATGGEIAKLAIGNSKLHIQIPAGYQPRQAIGFSLITMVSILNTVFSAGMSPIIDRTIAKIREVKGQAAEVHSNNPMIQIASQIASRPVIIYSSEKMFPAAVRFKGQISENAKLLAFANTIPEMNHNEIVGWETVEKAAKENFNVVLIRDKNDHAQVQRRFDIIRSMLSEKTLVTEIQTEGETYLEKFITLIYRVDWISYYMAIVRRQDPTPVDIITKLKNALAK